MTASPQLRLYAGDDDQDVRPSTPRAKSHRRKSAQSADNLTPAQRAALFKIMHARGMSIDDIRAMTPSGSVSMLTVSQASALLDLLNAGTPHAKSRPPYVGHRGSQRPRRPENVIAMASAEQYDLIDKRYRIALGWTPAVLREFLKRRHYAFDATRSMDNIVTSAEAVAAIELLKAILFRVLVAHAKAVGQTVHDHGPLTDCISTAMRSLPPHDCLAELLRCRRLGLAAQVGDLTVDAVISKASLTSGRLGSAAATCADVAELVMFLEQKIAAASPHDSKLKTQNSSTQRSATDGSPT